MENIRRPNAHWWLFTNSNSQGFEVKYILAALSAAITSFLPAQAQVGPNIDESARELSNPGAANATMNFKFEYRTFRGDLSGAGPNIR